MLLFIFISSDVYYEEVAEGVFFIIIFSKEFFIWNLFA
jgi:hypothetical protein